MPQTNILSSLQLLRFAAAFWVLLFHLDMDRSGYNGVDVFFVISGFVMYYSLCYKPRPDVVHFMMNRFTKIFFLYWVVLLLLYLVQPFSFTRSVVGTILLLPGHESLLGVSWSLSYELYFYLLTAWVVYFVNTGFQARVYRLLFVLSISVTLFNLGSPAFKGGTVNFLIGSNLWEFLLGILSAYLFSRYTSRIPVRNSIAMLLTGILALCFIPVAYHHPVAWLVYGPLSFLTVFSMAVIEKNHPVPSFIAKQMNILGDASYAIYLLGPIVILFFPPHDTATKILVIASTISAAIAIHLLIEKRFLSWSRNRYFHWRRMRPSLHAS